MKTKFIELSILLSSVLLMSIFGAIYSLVFAGAAGWAMIGMAPSFSFGLVSKLVCPPGSSIQYADQSNSPGEAQKTTNCLAPDGSSQPTSYEGAVLAVNRVLFLLCFLPTFIPGAILMRLTIRRWAQTASDVETVPDDEDDE